MTTLPKDDLCERILAIDPDGSGALLRTKATQLADIMLPRTVLTDGRFGFRANLRTKITLQLGNAPSADAPTETIELLAYDSEIHLKDPVLTLDGDMLVELETLSYVAKGISKELWPGETVTLRVGSGQDPMLRPTFGFLQISPLKQLGVDPVLSVQHVFIEAETPIGDLRNREAAIMHCDLLSIPPVNQPYRQQGIVELVDDTGDVVALKIDTESEILEVD